MGNNPGSLTRLGGNLILAGVSNNITAANLNVGTSTSAQAGPLCTFVLGAGTNIINAANINIANNKCSATVSFAAPTGGLRIRGVSGADTDRANITIGNRNQTGTGTCTGNALLSGGQVDIKAGTLTIGANPNTGTTTGDTGTGFLQFDTGVVDATNIILATSTTALGAANGTLTVGTNGTLVIGAGGLSLVNQAASGACSGTLNISNGTVNCNGSITVTTATGTSTINFITGGKLNLAAGCFVGTLALSVGSLNLIEGTTIQFGLPSATQTNIVVNSLTWPANDSLLTFSISGLPAGLSVGSTFPILQFNSMSGGTFTAPALSLPPGVTGNLSLNGNTIWLTVTGGVGPGIGGLNQLINPGFELTPAKTGWTTAGTTPQVTIGTATYLNSTNGACAHDATAQLVVSHAGTNVANIAGPGLVGAGVSSWSQTVAAVPGSTFTAGAFTYVSHEDLMAGKNSFYYEVDFLDGNGAVLASYESFVVTNLTCGEITPFPVDTWVHLAVTNQMQVAGGTNTGVIISNLPNGIITAPPQSASVHFAALFLQQTNTDHGSVHFDDANLGLVSGPVPPTLTAISPNLVTLCTNTTLTCTAASTVSTISSAQLIVRSTSLGALTTNTVTNTVGSAGLTVTGIGTPTANITYALAPNTIYQSIVIKATDANGVTVTSGGAVLDTIVPSLVIEASDFNFNSGQFFDTPANGGLALYLNQVGSSGIDENKGTRSATRSYYRPSDAVILQDANAGSGTPPTATEQKFVTAAANGDTTDVEQEVGFNSPGDWLNYARTFGTGGSAPAGTYNVWCYVATSGSGIQGTLSKVTSDPTQPNQTTSLLGYWGTSAFTDNGYNNYRYVPLVDQFGDRVSVTLGGGQQTLRSTVMNNPNFGFYLLVPVVPTLTPVLQSVYPDGTSGYQTTNHFSFVVGPANGASIVTNGIHLTLNGVDVSSSLLYSQTGGVWTVTYPIQSNSVYTAVINVTNTSGLSTTYSVSFDTFDMNNYQWEAVDYDFSTNDGSFWLGGQFIDNPVPTADVNAPLTGTYATNSYFGYPTGFQPGNDPFGQGAIAQQGIDINFTNTQTGVNSAYRYDGVGSQVATDFVRTKFLEAQTNFNDSNIGQFNIGFFNNGNWLNYTRDYPTNTYNVWGRLAGGNGAFSGTKLSLVTGGVGTSNQTSTVLGSFADTNAAGWQTYHWIPLLDTNGNKVAVQLGGNATLRLTSGNNLNALFFMLTPATVLQPFSISVSLTGSQINISIPTQAGHSYTLLSATSLAGSWTPVGSSIAGDGTVHVVSQSATASQGYYRVSAQ